MKDNLPPFYVGQKVVALQDCICPVNGYVFFKKGQEFTVKELHLCCMWKVDVGVLLDRARECPHCNEVSYKVTWFEPTYFAPIETTFQSITLSEVIEIETPLICSN